MSPLSNTACWCPLHKNTACWTPVFDDFPECPRHPEACYLPYRPTFLKTTPLGCSADRNVDIPNLMQTAQVETASDYIWMGWSARQTRQLFLKDHVSMFTMFTSEQDCRSTGKKVGEQKEWILSMQPTVKKCLHVVSLRHLRTNGNLWMIHCRFVKKTEAPMGLERLLVLTQPNIYLMSCFNAHERLGIIIIIIIPLGWF